MNSQFETYVKPAVLRLEFAMDVGVSLTQNCKTTNSPNVGTSPCTSTTSETGPCTTVGS
jgi:hypothetical protein